MKKSLHSSTIPETGETKLNPSFSWLNATQFFGALNDNVFKLLCIFFGIHLLGQAHKSDIVSTGGIVFTIPFLLFLPAAGVLADRFSKSRITVLMKILEIGIMALAATVFFFGAQHWAIYATYSVLFLLGTQAAFFSPSKYGLIPELVGREQLSKANGWIEAATFVAIICGSVLGPYLTDSLDHQFGYCAIVCVAVAIAGTITSMKIEHTPALGTKAKISPISAVNVWRTMRDIWSDKHLVLAIFGAAYFLFVGGFLQLNVIPYGMAHMINPVTLDYLSDTQAGYQFLPAALGIGIGSVWAARLSGRNIEFGTVPLGAFGLAIFTMLMGLMFGDIGKHEISMTGENQADVVLLNSKSGIGTHGFPTAMTNIFQVTENDGTIKTTRQVVAVSNGEIPWLADGGFESGRFSTNNWQSFNSNAVIVSTNPHKGSGTRSVKLMGAADGPMIFSHSLGARRAQTWWLSGWMMTPTNAAISPTNRIEARIEFYDAGSRLLKTHYAPFVTNSMPTPGDYVPFHITSVAPLHARSVRASFRYVQQNGEPGAVFVDDVTLTQMGQSAGYALSLAWVLFLIFMTGVGAGLFVVPLQSFIQMRAPHGKLGEVWAAKAFMEWIGVLIASGLIWFLESFLKFSPARSFFVVGALTLVMTGVTLKVLPDFFVRFMVMCITRTIYRIREIGVENLPSEGPALLVANHVSRMDALQILAVQQRRIRFLMERSIYERSRFRPLFKLMGVIPISDNDSPKKIIEALHAARAALDNGFMVCIFAEGRLTRSGNMFEFRHGFERILRGSNYPVIPVYIGGTWGSIFSHYYDPNQAKVPLRVPYPATIIFGKPMPATATAPEIRQCVMELSSEYFEDRKPMHRSLAREWIGVARKNWSVHAMSDTTGRRLTYGESLTASVALARVIGRMTAGQKNVGVLLPTTCGCALVNLALAILHKTSVNLNFTASKEAFDSAIKQSEIKTIISSGAFLEKMPELAGLPGLVKIEEITKQIGGGAKLSAFLFAKFAPMPLIANDRKCNADDLATIIFSSGTTGEPKGVMLTQHNIISNVEALRMVFRPRQGYNIAATLPLFHSFGYTAGVWFPLLCGMAASYHVSPLDGGKIAEMVRENKCMALFSTPSFLLAYLRKAKPEDFKSLLYVITGAEKLKPRIAEAFTERFGITPLEGYGTTELSPVAALSLPHVESDGIRQPGHKPGSVGQPVPGVSVRIVDPDTNEILPPNKPGLLLIKGPNVMLGYLGKPQLTAEVIQDGWYRTGDIAQIDEEGFVFITDRLARFSKIAGEMVPHGAIEDEYLRGLGKHEPVLAVASVPDEKKGERLVVMYTDAAGDPEKLREIIEKSPIPNLWKPAKNSYYKIDALPMTGTGKLDVKTLHKLARAAAEKPVPPQA